PTSGSYHACRCRRCPATASGTVALPGGNTAASSTSCRNSAGTSVTAITTSDPVVFPVRPTEGLHGYRAVDKPQTPGRGYKKRTSMSESRTWLEVVMPYYRRVGEIPRKRHTQYRQPDGRLYAEELMGVEGFSADSSLLYHRHLPTAIVASET